MSLSQWPTQERPRERLLQYGANALSDSELLAIILQTGTRGKNVMELAREVLQQSGGLRNLFAADNEAITKLPGIGLQKLTLLRASWEITKRVLKEQTQQQNLFTHPQACFDYLITELRPLKQEVFACLFLDTQLRIIQFEKLFFGTLDQAHVHPRQVVTKALKYNAHAVIVSHNHPFSEAYPSQSDKAITSQLKKALDLVDILLVDHIIVGENTCCSLAERGELR